MKKNSHRGHCILESYLFTYLSVHYLYKTCITQVGINYSTKYWVLLFEVWLTKSFMMQRCIHCFSVHMLTIGSITLRVMSVPVNSAPTPHYSALCRPWVSLFDFSLMHQEEHFKLPGNLTCYWCKVFMARTTFWAVGVVSHCGTAKGVINNSRHMDGAAKLPPRFWIWWAMFKAQTQLRIHRL